MRTSEASSSFFEYSKVVDFSQEYLNTYYRVPPPADERALLPFVTDILDHTELPRLENGLIEHLEAACGPTVHHALAFSHYVDRIWMGDYLPENLEALRRWMAKDPQAHSWSDYTDFILTLQRRAPVSRGEIDRHEDLTRQKIAGLLHCDFMRPRILDECRVFSSLSCFYGAEAVGTTKQAVGQIIERLAGVVMPGGLLFLAALAEAPSYVYAASKGVKRTLPTTSLCKDDLGEILRLCSLSILRLEEARIGENDIEGVSRILLAAARVE